MQRRKFLATVGGLAAGSAAAIGTGAFTQADATRTVDASVVNDNSAYLGLLDSDPNGLPNDEYAVGAGQGQIKLRFDGNDDMDDVGGFVGGSGDGLGADSVYYFDGVFAAASKSKEQINVDIDWSGLDHPENFYFYNKMYEADDFGDVGVDLPTPADYTNRVANGIMGGTFVGIGVAIETPDVEVDDWENWETGEIIVSATSSKENYISNS